MNILKKILYPKLIIRIILIPIATFSLVYSLINIDTLIFFQYIAYFISFYTLLIWCLKIPKIIIYFKKIISNNKLYIKWHNDISFKVKTSLNISFVWNTSYGIFQLFLGIKLNSLWYYSFAIYYILLAFMRSFLFSHTRKFNPGENIKSECKKYTICGFILLLLNLALTIIEYYIIFKDMSFKHHQYTVIAMALYTFISFSVALINVFKYKKFNSPVVTAAKIISLCVACVSMVTLTSSMLYVFSSSVNSQNKIILTVESTVVSLFIIIMAIYMITNGIKKLSLITKCDRE